MTTNRTYGEGCAIAHALDLVGERWALLAIRELILGPKRFTDLRAGIPHVSPNVLAQRLRELEQAGIVRRAALPPPAGSRVYELTEWGRELEPALLALGSWGARSALLPHDAGMSTDAQVLALRTVFDPAAAEGFEAAVELRLGGERFHARVAGGGFEIERGAALAPDAVIEADQAGLASVLWRGRRLAEAQRSGDLTIDGSETVAARFLTLFPAPTPAGGQHSASVVEARR